MINQRHEDYAEAVLLSLLLAESTQVPERQPLTVTPKLIVRALT